MLKQNTKPSKTKNPPITLVLQVFTWIEVIVLTAASILLFFFPEISQSRWVWKIKPFNSHFLGAVYLAAIIPTAMLLVVRQWKIARLIVPMQLTFTSILLVVSLFYLESFNFNRRITWGWFFLYTIIPLTTACHVWLYRRLRPVESTFVSSSWRFFLRVQTFFLTFYGLGLLLAPNTFTAFWPWAIDNFHGQLYSAVFLTLAIGAFLLSRVCLYSELFTLGLTEFTLGLTQILGLLKANAILPKINWLMPNTWFWISIFVLLLISGMAMILQSQRPVSNNK
jgi:hypothetical protein